MSEYWPEEEGGLATREETRQKVEKPRLYRVLLHNDNYTTMEFVILVLMQVFRHSETKAIELMFDVHRKGAGLAGVYQREIAETKLQKVTDMARQAEFPFMCTMEPE